MESKLDNGYVPAWATCPFRVKCGIAIKGDCHHMGLAHPREFLCGTAQEFDAIEQQEFDYIRIPDPTTYADDGNGSLILYYESKEKLATAMRIFTDRDPAVTEAVNRQDSHLNQIMLNDQEPKTD